jgi:hypothetical protein
LITKKGGVDLFIRIINFRVKLLREIERFFQYKKKAEILHKEFVLAICTSNFILNKIVPMERIEEIIFSESERILLFTIESLKVSLSSKEVIWGKESVQRSWNSIPKYKTARIKRELEAIRETTKGFRFYQEEVGKVINYIEKRDNSRCCS